jgi:hypothetical protein
MRLAPRVEVADDDDALLADFNSHLRTNQITETARVARRLAGFVGKYGVADSVGVKLSGHIYALAGAVNNAEFAALAKFFFYGNFVGGRVHRRTFYCISFFPGKSIKAGDRRRGYFGDGSDFD